MPRLDAFDEEFAREEPAIVLAPSRKQRFWNWILVGVLVGAGAVSALALVWPDADGQPRLETQAVSRSPRSAIREGADEQVSRLARELEALKKDMRELAEAHRQAADTIASLQAAEQEAGNSAASAHWYSDLATLNFATSGQGRGAVVAPRPVGVARPYFRRREGAAPLSLEAPQ